MNAFLVALLASAVVLVSARTTEKVGLKARLLTPDEETLKLLLSTPGGSIGGGDSKVQVGRIQYNLNRDFETRFNPRNPTSDWKFLSTKDGKYAADNGALVRDGISSVELISIPFAKNAEDQSRVSLLSNYEAVLVNKVKFVVEPEHKLTVRAAFAVKVKNIEDHPFGKNAVTNATDDPTLGSAGISLASSGKGGLMFSIVATNKGIWAVYERNRVGLVEHPERDDKIFTILHRLADRESPSEEIDAAITYVRSQNLVHYKLNNVVVHTIKNLGTLPANEPGTLVHTTTRPDLVRVEPKEFTVMVGIMSWIDAQDPNNQAHSYANQRLTSDNVYDEKAKFVDETGNKMYNLWGQGAVMKIHDIEIKLEESTGREDKNELEGREGGQKSYEQVDGKLIVPSPIVDVEELSLFNGERVPRINQQDDQDQLAQQDDEESSSVVEKKNKPLPKVRSARRQESDEETSSINDNKKVPRRQPEQQHARTARLQGGEDNEDSVRRNNNNEYASHQPQPNQYSGKIRNN